MVKNVVKLGFQDTGIIWRHCIYHKHAQLHGMSYNSTLQRFYCFVLRLELHDGAVMRFQAGTDPFWLIREDGLSIVVSNPVYAWGKSPNPNVLCWQNRYLSFHSGSESWTPNLQFFNCLIREKKKPWVESFFFFFCTRLSYVVLCPIKAFLFVK